MRKVTRNYLFLHIYQLLLCHWLHHWMAAYCYHDTGFTIAYCYYDTGFTIEWLPIVTMSLASPWNGCLLLPCHWLHHGMAALFYPVFAEYFGSCNIFTLRLLHVPLLKNWAFWGHTDRLKLLFVCCKKAWPNFALLKIVPWETTAHRAHVFNHSERGNKISLSRQC